MIKIPSREWLTTQPWKSLALHEVETFASKRLLASKIGLDWLRMLVPGWWKVQLTHRVELVVGALIVWLGEVMVVESLVLFGGMVGMVVAGADVVRGRGRGEGEVVRWVACCCCCCCCWWWWIRGWWLWYYDHDHDYEKHLGRRRQAGEVGWSHWAPLLGLSQGLPTPWNDSNDYIVLVMVVLVLVIV